MTDTSTLRAAHKHSNWSAQDADWGGTVHMQARRRWMSTHSLPVWLLITTSRTRLWYDGQTLGMPPVTATPTEWGRFQLHRCSKFQHSKCLKLGIASPPPSLLPLLPFHPWAGSAKPSLVHHPSLAIVTRSSQNTHPSRVKPRSNLVKPFGQNLTPSYHYQHIPHS